MSKNDDKHPQWTHAEWTAEAIVRFGESPVLWAFVCPMCGTVSTAGDFARLGVDGGRAAQECIGRVMTEQDGIKRPAAGDKSVKPCDWAAFGLFGGPVSVTMDSGKITHAFRFAEPVGV